MTFYDLTTKNAFVLCSQGPTNDDDANISRQQRELRFCQTNLKLRWRKIIFTGSVSVSVRGPRRPRSVPSEPCHAWAVSLQPFIRTNRTQRKATVADYPPTAAATRLSKNDDAALEDRRCETDPRDAGFVRLLLLLLARLMRSWELQ